jgi:zinc protease
LVTAAGTVVLCEESHALPLVYMGLSLRTGSLHDPRGLEGLTRVCSRMLRMGTRKLEAPAVEERIDALGAQLSIGCASSYLHIGGAVVEHNLEAFFSLLCELVTTPAFRARDLARVKRETVAELASICDDDRVLCGRSFRAFTFGEHPYGRPISGRLQSVQAISRADVLAHYARHYVSENMVVGFSGAITPARAAQLVERHLTLPRGRAPADIVKPPRMSKGRRVLIVDKPERTQTQILIGTLGTHVDDPDHTALGVGNVIFGGLFTARLTREVRGKRGLSYGASSGLGHDRERELWSMSTFPSAKDACACIALQLRLYEEWIKHGVRASELRMAKSFLVKSNAFEIDTAAKRLDQRVEREVFDLPDDYHSGFTARVNAVTRAEVNAALKRRLSLKDFTLVVVASAKDLKPGLSRLPGVSRVSVVPFDRVT